MANNRGRVALIGRIGSGKTTLVQCLSNEYQKYKKTQQVTYSPNFLDTPGEFLELPCFRPQAINVTCDAGLIILVNSGTDCQNSVPPNFIKTYNRPVIGVITKIDDKNCNLKRSYRYLQYAGIRENEIVPVSAFSGEGIVDLKALIENALF